MPLDNYEPFTIRALGSVKAKVKREAKRTGQSINKTAEKLLIEALRARDKDKGDS